MRVFWMSLFLVGLCLAKEEEAADDLQAIEGRRLEKSGDTSCSGCASKPVDKTSSSIVVPNLSSLLADKTPLSHILPTADYGSSHGIPTYPTEDLLLKIGNMVSYLGSLTTKDTATDPHGSDDTVYVDESDLTDLTGLLSVLGIGTVAGVDTKGAALGKLISLLNLFLSGVLEIGSRGLEIANFILAIIGLALLVVYVSSNDGDLGVLGFGGTGTGTGTGTASNYRSFMDSPMVDGLTNLVYDAINKYD